MRSALGYASRRVRATSEGRDVVVGERKTTPEVAPQSPDRTALAKFRTQLALDRTTLAWIRTTLTMATFGFGTVAFFRSLREKSPTPDVVHLHQSAIRFGVSLVVLGTVSTVLAGASHWLTLRRLRRDEPLTLTQWPVSIAVAVLLSVLGLVALWAVVDR
jgi:uncharacterized membrane protein YidH (DUF202 family)